MIGSLLNQADAALEPLGDGKYVVIDAFLATYEINYWRSLAIEKKAAGVMRPAAVGQGIRRVVAGAIRNDWTSWIEPDRRHAMEGRLAAALERLRLALNERFLLGLFDLELHLAMYPPGGFYRAHVDCLRDDDHRIISAILYLNDDWSADAGGMLRIWQDARHVNYADIAPIAGRLVLFPSATTLHEVLPTAQRRCTLTGWFRRREESNSRSGG
ncbi:MAG: 2OG-Fe(II) oxygenase [Betaproteobacteria bacterium]|nr:2OG-Fe(II) oxygenase [Betaproteobacteria bacterium]